MQYNPVTEKQIKAFEEILGKAYVIKGREETEAYAMDHTEDLKYYPEVVLIPGNTAEVSAILAHCNLHKIPVTARGAGTGLSGGALAIFGGVSLSMHRFNKIIEIDERNFQVSVEPGVINEALQNAVKEKGFEAVPNPKDLDEGEPEE